MNELLGIAQRFMIDGQAVEAKPLGNGHLHKTYLLTAKQGTVQNHYVLQEVNTLVFKDADALMENIHRVTTHLAKKLPPSEVRRRTMAFIPTRDGGLYLKDEQGKCWRLCWYVQGSYTVEVPKNTRQIYQSARAFGNFLKNLADIEGPPLKETIPDFHNGVKRYQRLTQAIREDKVGRVKEARPEAELILKNADIFEKMAQWIRTGALPLRTTHNDTKVNNVLFDKATDEAICVIDLDTVMPGVAAYDFGDQVRTTVSESEEDQTDLSGIAVQMDRFEAIAKGYLDGTAGMLTAIEIESLMLGAKMFPLIMATRFLTDFFEGDWYFSTHRPGHNLDRCRTQLTLFESICRNEKQMAAVLGK
jgi:aminoglycoside phosphotransferase (APT) family kinase protein